MPVNELLDQQRRDLWHGYVHCWSACCGKRYILPYEEFVEGPACWEHLGDIVDEPHLPGAMARWVFYGESRAR